MIYPSEPYPAYKPSRVSWLGDLPAHWKVVRLKGNVANIVNKTEGSGSDDIYLALEHVESWTGRIRVTAPGFGIDSQTIRFQAEDVLFGKLRPYLAKVTRPCKNGVCVSEFMVLRCRHDNLMPSYLEHLLRSKPVIDAVDASTFGAKMPRTEWRFIGGMVQPVPPLPEQNAIVRFLDHIDRHIQQYIHAKQKLLTLHGEQRLAIIHQAVTGQIDVRTGKPYPVYKPSGVGWLGAVPEHWEVRRLKTLCRMKSGDSITAISIEPEGKYPVYGGNGLRGYTSKHTHCGDFALIGRQGALCGNVHIARGRFYASEHAVVAILNPGYVLEWFVAVLGQMNLNQYSIAAAQPGLAVERVLNLSITVPPLAEEARIATYIEQQTGGIYTAISHTHRQIELFQEYRTRLIADVVIGKLDVREAAANLPDDTELMEAMDDPPEISSVGDAVSRVAG